MTIITIIKSTIAHIITGRNHFSGSKVSFASEHKEETILLSECEELETELDVVDAERIIL